MSKNKNNHEKKMPKSRNWVAVAAFQRSGAGSHKSKKSYTRKEKHRIRYS